VFFKKRWNLSLMGTECSTRRGLLTTVGRVVHKVSIRHPNFIGFFVPDSAEGRWSISYRIWTTRNWVIETFFFKLSPQSNDRWHALMASPPVFVGVKTNGIPMAFQPMHEGDFARYAVELAGLVVAGRH
jgi:hypothetical protein